MGFVVSKLAAETISTNLAKPSNSISGRIIGNIIKKRNAQTEKIAAQLCNIQPDHQVLEVGFGPGIGLQAAYSYIKDGNGIIHGVEISDRMINQASELLQKEITSGKIILHPKSVTQLPFDDSMIDCVFHTNCYYFWPDMDKAVTELYRVIKPDGVMVAVRNQKTVEESETKGYMKYGNTDPERYMTSMEKNGFVNIREEDVTEDGLEPGLIAIYATAKK